jgi:hypothetical protein
MHTTRAQVVAWVALGWLASGATAQPVVRIGAEARIELGAERGADRVHLKARLLDDQERPLAGLVLSLEVRTAEGQRITGRGDMRTSREGEVEIVIPDGLERVVASALFDGDAFHAAARAEAVFELRLAPVELSFVQPASSVIDLGLSAHPISLRARCDAGVSGIEVTLYDESDRLLVSAVTDELGSARAELPALRLGPPGIGKLRAHTLGDSARAPTASEMAIVRWSATSVSLELAPTSDGLEARGVLQAGALPIERATISIFDAREAHVASFTTDANGHFAGKVTASQLAGASKANDGRVSLHARYVSDMPWLGSSESAPREAQAEASVGLRHAWALATPIAIGLALFALRRLRRGAPPRAPVESATGPGISPGKPARIRSGAMTISLLVRDARTGKPIHRASATLGNAAGERDEAAAGLMGLIELAVRSPGEHALHVQAQGFRALECSVRTPHRGEWTRAVVRLESLRDAALAAWTPVAAQLAASSEGAHASTVRETLERAAQHAHVARPSALVLVDATEQAAYMRSAPSTEEVAHLEQQAANLARVIEDKRRA